MAVIALGIGGIGRGGDAACRHDRQIGDAPFGPVFGNHHHPVAVFQPQARKAFGQQAHLPRRFGIADRLPRAADLGGQERLVAAFVGALEEQADQIARVDDILDCTCRASSADCAGCTRLSAMQQVEARAQAQAMTEATPSLRGSAAPSQWPSTQFHSIGLERQPPFGDGVAERLQRCAHRQQRRTLLHRQIALPGA